jgi:hypothetical protein
MPMVDTALFFIKVLLFILLQAIVKGLTKFIDLEAKKDDTILASSYAIKTMNLV